MWKRNATCLNISCMCIHFSLFSTIRNYNIEKKSVFYYLFFLGVGRHERTPSNQSISGIEKIDRTITICDQCGLDT